MYWRVPVGSEGFENTSLNLFELLSIISKRSFQYIYQCKMLGQHFIELLTGQSRLEAENGTFICKYIGCSERHLTNLFKHQDFKQGEVTRL